MDQVENPSEKGKRMFLDFCESKKYKEIRVRLNPKGEIYFIETTKSVRRKANDGIIVAHQIPKSGYHKVNILINHGKVDYLTVNDCHIIEGLEKFND